MSDNASAGAFHISMEPSEAQIFRGACQIYAGYLAAGRVAEGDEDQFMRKAMEDAMFMAKTLDENIASDDELKGKLGSGPGFFGK